MSRNQREGRYVGYINGKHVRQGERVPHAPGHDLALQIAANSKRKSTYFRDWRLQRYGESETAK